MTRRILSQLLGASVAGVCCSVSICFASDFLEPYESMVLVDEVPYTEPDSTFAAAGTIALESYESEPVTPASSTDYLEQNVTLMNSGEATSTTLVTVLDPATSASCQRFDTEVSGSGTEDDPNITKQFMGKLMISESSFTASSQTDFDGLPEGNIILSDESEVVRETWRLDYATCEYSIREEMTRELSGYARAFPNTVLYTETYDHEERWEGAMGGWVLTGGYRYETRETSSQSYTPEPVPNTISVVSTTIVPVGNGNFDEYSELFYDHYLYYNSSYQGIQHCGTETTYRRLINGQVQEHSVEQVGCDLLQNYFKFIDPFGSLG